MSSDCRRDIGMNEVVPLEEQRLRQASLFLLAHTLEPLANSSGDRTGQGFASLAGKLLYKAAGFPVFMFRLISLPLCEPRVENIGSATFPVKTPGPPMP
jgi:hypothetical protein